MRSFFRCVKTFKASYVAVMSQTVLFISSCQWPNLTEQEKILRVNLRAVVAQSSKLSYHLRKGSGSLVRAPIGLPKFTIVVVNR